MASEKATYWMAVGLLTLFMGNHFVSRIGGNCLASKARVAVERISGQADHLMAMAEVAMGRTSTRFDRAQAAMEMAQVRMASVQTQFARQQAACARLEGSRARMMVRQQLVQMDIPALVSRPRIEMVMPRPPAVPSADPI
ncbi:MAG TPA: hypothetical protein VK763_18465 [Terriglobales bacterium]|nr:hypothetical protein [Terriglobales bacterium]